ncbi:ribonuclease E [Heyndrickxia sporothermodurans]|nr:ribonuclease E [Heyndrickxia sporothermodurans]
MNEIIINDRTSEKRFATKINNEVTKIFIEQPQDQTKVGNIYIGKVVDVKNGMNACFVDIGGDKNGFIHRDQLPSYILSKDPNKEYQSISKFVHKGESILVQVKKDETNIKGPLLTAVIEIPGEKMIYLPQGCYIAVSKKGNEQNRSKWREIAQKHQLNQEGFIIRTETLHSSEEEWLIELNSLRQQFQRILEKSEKLKAPNLVFKSSLFEKELINELIRLKSGKVISDNQEVIRLIEQNISEMKEWEFIQHYSEESIFSTHQIESEIDKSLKRVIWLENGSYFVIDETEALVCIDVNTGKFSGSKNLHDTVLQTNLLAAKEIVRQILLRDYGGMILIDFIDMKQENHQKLVEKAIQNEMKKDSKQFRLVGFTPLGIFQLTRKKTKKSLSETLLTPCPVCSGKGKVESAETIAFRLERELWEKPFKEHEAVLIELTEDVKTVFCGENNRHLQRIEDILNVKIILKVISYCRPIFFLRQFGLKEELAIKLNK